MRYGETAYVDREPLVPIPAKHWEDFDIEMGSVARGEVNEKIHTYNKHQAASGGKGMVGGYLDLHVEAAKAVAWLEGPAIELRGRIDAKENQRRG